VVAIATSHNFNLALKHDGTVVGWGGDNVQVSPPANLTGVVGIAAGIAHGLAVRSDGTVVGWGSNIFGESTPPANLTGVVAVAAAGYHSLALKSDGHVVAWGENDTGQSSPPTNLTGAVAIATGFAHSLALRNDGIVIAWGRGGAGQGLVPSSLTGVVVIAAGGVDSLALTCAPSAPSGVTVVGVDSNRVDLSWTDTAYTEEGFAIERSIGINPGAWTQIATVDSNVTSYTDTTVLPDTFSTTECGPLVQAAVLGTVSPGRSFTCFPPRI
jgi:hypothetical protein